MQHCRKYGTKLPFLPVHGAEELRLYGRLMRRTQGAVDFEQLALKWCTHVDGIHIWPKLPVYLRVHANTFERNQRVKRTLSELQAGQEQLREMNDATSALPVCDAVAQGGAI